MWISRKRVSSATLLPYLSDDQSKTGKAGYYTIEMSKEKDVRMLGEFLEDGKHIDHGVAPVEGAELQKIMDLARGEGAEMTS